MVLNELRKHGVDTRIVARTPATLVTAMFVREDGGRQSITNQAHRYNFHPEMELSLLSGARALILGSLFRAPFDDPDVIHAVVSGAKAGGQLVVADTKIPNFRFLALEDIRDSLALIDYITPNEDEARHFTGKDEPEEMADVFLDYGVRNAVIKLGSKGCLLMMICLAAAWTLASAEEEYTIDNIRRYVAGVDELDMTFWSARLFKRISEELQC